MYNNMPEVSAQIEKLDIDIESLHKAMDVHRITSETIDKLFELFTEQQNMNRYLAAEINKRTKKRNSQ